MIRTDLKNLSFKTYIDSQLTTVDYQSLFDNKTVVLLSVNGILDNVTTHEHLDAFNKTVDEFKELGIDAVYCTNCLEPMLPPYLDRFFKNIVALPDPTLGLIAHVKESFTVNRDISVLAKHWQYVTIFKNGTPVKLFQNPVTDSISWKVAKSPMFRYRNLTPKVVKDYLTNNPV